VQVARTARPLLAGRFELGDAIGRGGTAVVRRARDLATGATVAVKLIEDADGRGRERFEREARALARLAVPGVVRYVAHGGEAGRLYLVEEWLAGDALRGRLAEPGVTAAEAVRIARDAAVALAAAHAAGIVHRDIKPEHLWLGPDDRVTLIDFGIARGASDPRVTATGSSIGTAGYMAPEQARGDRAIDARADVFALGAVLFEALAGVPAFRGRTEGATRGKVLVAAPPALACPEAPPALIALVEAMLAKRPDDRPADGAAVAAALAAIAVGPGPRRRAGDGGVDPTRVVPREPGGAPTEPCAAPREPGGALTEPRAAPRAFVIAAGHAVADPGQLAALAGAPVELVDGALWLAVVATSAGRALAAARAWHDLLGTPAAVAAGALDAAVDWVADTVARATLLGEFAAFAAPPGAVQCDPATTRLLRAEAP
jgi:hypothetical protein